MKRWTLLCVLLVCALTAARADALPGEQPADWRVHAEVRVAIEFWAARGVTGCQGGIDTKVYEALPTEDGTGDALEHGSNCRIWVDSRLVADIRQPAPRWARELYAGIECGIVAHAVGHALGLQHTATGVMSEREIETPWDCRLWARSVFPRPLRLHVTVRRAMRSFVRH